MGVEGGGHIGASRIVILQAGNSRLENVAGVPQSRTLVHEFVEPFLSDGEMELLDQEGELGMEGSEERENPLEELDGHEVGGGEGAFQVVEPAGEKRVEAVNRSGSGIHGEGNGKRWKEGEGGRCSGGRGRERERVI